MIAESDLTAYLEAINEELREEYNKSGLPKRTKEQNINIQTLILVQMGMVTRIIEYIESGGLSKAGTNKLPLEPIP